LSGSEGLVVTSNTLGSALISVAYKDMAESVRKTVVNVVEPDRLSLWIVPVAYANEPTLPFPVGSGQHATSYLIHGQDYIMTVRVFDPAGSSIYSLDVRSNFFFPLWLWFGCLLTFFFPFVSLLSSK